MQIVKQAITLDGDGAATVTTENVKGKLLAIWFRQSPHAIADTVDLTITGGTSAQALLTASNVASNTFFYPRTPAEDNAGADVTFDGTNEIYEPMVIFGEGIKCVVAQGTANASFEMWYALD